MLEGRLRLLPCVQVPRLVPPDSWPQVCCICNREVLEEGKQGGGPPAAAGAATGGAGGVLGERRR